VAPMQLWLINGAKTMNLKNYINEESTIDRFPNNNLLTEAGLSRVISGLKSDSFAILTAYRFGNKSSDNVQLNRKLRGFLNSKKMGVYQLVGHWRECQIDNIDYDDCPENKLVDVIERSYLVVKPSTMIQNYFNDIILDLVKEYKQDAAILSIYDDIFVLKSDGGMIRIGSKVSLNKIGQAYSQFVKKMDIPLVFEAEVPSSISGCMIFKSSGVKYPTDCKINEYRNINELYSIPFDVLSKFMNEATDDQMIKYRNAIINENVIDLIDILEEFSYA